MLLRNPPKQGSHWAIMEFILPAGSWAKWTLAISACLACCSKSFSQTESDRLPSTPLEETREVAIDEFVFRVPAGFSFEKIAPKNLTTWPIVATWDQDGNLVIAESAGVKQPVQEQLKNKPHRIVRLLDTDRDGFFDSRQIVAEELAFPEGVLCIGNDILVSAPPQIWRLTDADGDGVCESRSVWHDGQTLTGCANDLHGPFLGPEGWIYWCKSAFAEQSFPIRGPFSPKSTASHLYRRPLQSEVADRIMTGGMDNLVDIAFDDSGDRYFVSTFLHHPGKGVRDGLGHAVYGAVFGKDHAVLRSHVKTGPLMTPIVEMGPAAPAGVLVTSERNPWSHGSSDAPTLVAAQFNLQRVTAHQLARQGSSYISNTVNLVVSEQLDFHPVDILEDVDGSLIVVDTGGWYDLCCPSSGTEERIAKGGIYRLRAKSSNTSLPNILKKIEEAIASGRAVELLTHSNRRVREHATTFLSENGLLLQPDTMTKIQSILEGSDRPTDQRLAAFWALSRSLVSGASLPTQTPEFVKRSLRVQDPSVVSAALELTATYAWKDARMEVEGILHDSTEPRLQRLAAACLGRIGADESLDILMESWRRLSRATPDGRDRMLEHSIQYAMMEIVARTSETEGATQKIRNFLTSQNDDKTMTASLRILKELGRLDSSSIPSLIVASRSSSHALAELAYSCIGSNSQLVGAYVDALRTLSTDQMQRDIKSISAVFQVAHSDPAVIRWVDENLLKRESLEPWQWELLFSVLDSFRNQPLPDPWSSGLADLIQQPGERSSSLIEKIGATTLSKNAKELLQALATRMNSDDLRTSATAIAMIPRGIVAVPSQTQARLVRAVLEPSHSDREVAKQGLRRLDLDSSAWEELFQALPSFSPVEFGVVVETLATSQYAKQDSVASKLLRALPSLSLSKTLFQEQLERWFSNHSGDIKVLVKSTAEQLFAPPPDLVKTIEDLTERLQAGDAHRGQDVFRSSKAACSACHRIGYVGGNIGPELTKIGRSRSRKDLVESIAFPSHRIAQGYTSTSLLTKEDQVLSGLVAFEDDQRIELVVAADKRVSIEKRDVAQRSSSNTSLMPAGIDKVLTIQELSDLIAFLEQSK